MIPVEYRAADFRQAHREPRPESLAAAVLVYVLGLPLIVLLILVMLWPVPS